MARLTLADIDNMPSQVYKERLQSDPNFVAEVEALFAAPVQPAQPAQQEPESVDPSMPDRPTSNGLPHSSSVRDRAERPVVQAQPPALPAPPAPPVLPPVAQSELSYEYQPMDEFNRPLGGKQVIKYRTPDELAQKLAEQNTLLIRKLRQVSRDARLGIQDNIPSSAPRFEITEYKEKPLTAEERFQLTQDMNDPEKFAAARDRLLESAVGVSPAQLRERLTDLEMTNIQLRAKENFLSFAEQSRFLTGDARTDTENAKTLTDWMFKNKLAPTVENFDLACSTLRSVGLLNEAPVVQQVPVAPQSQPVESVVPKSQEPVQQPARISEPPAVQVTRQSVIPSGLTERNSSANGSEVPTRTVTGNYSYTLAEIDKMSADQYKKLARDPKFKDHVNRLEAEAAQRRRAQ